MSSSNYETLALDYIALVEEIKDLTEKKNLLRLELGKMLTSTPTRVGDYYIESTMSAGRKTLDRAALERRFGDLTPYMKTGKPTFTIRYKKAEEEVTD